MSENKKVRYSSEGFPLEDESPHPEHKPDKMREGEEMAEAEQMSAEPEPYDTTVVSSEPEPPQMSESAMPEAEKPQLQSNVPEEDEFKELAKKRMALPRIKPNELTFEEQIKLREFKHEESAEETVSMAVGSGDVIGLGVKSDTTISRKVNVWMHNHDSHSPLILKQEYQLMINVGKPRLNAIMSANAERLEKYAGNELLVALVSDDFSIEEDTQKLLLPLSGNSESISFKVIPTSAGVVNIFALFYFKINLLQMLSISINVLPTNKMKSNQGKLEPIAPHILLTADRGFESIAEIQDQK
jgi:hypothetical protein